MIGTDQDEITTYLRAVRTALGDLPDATRDELLDDLPEHLAEVLAEAGGTLVERLGPPAEYAAELRASIGFVGGFPDPPPNRGADFRAALLRRLRAADKRLGPLVGYERASAFIVLLRPAWWVFRGYLFAMGVAWLLDGGSQPMGLLPRVGGSDLIALVLIGLGALASIWFGRRAYTLHGWPRYALYAGTTVLVLVAVAGFAAADDRTQNSGYSDVTYSGGSQYDNVQDVFVYDQQGHLVPGARLFDQQGEPIQLGNPYCTDEATGESTHTDQMGYPYCPQSAPFRTPSAERSGSAAPSASTGRTAVPDLPVSPSTPR